MKLCTIKKVKYYSSSFDYFRLLLRTWILPIASCLFKLFGHGLWGLPCHRQMWDHLQNLGKTASLKLTLQNERAHLSTEMIPSKYLMSTCICSGSRCLCIRSWLMSSRSWVHLPQSPISFDPVSVGLDRNPHLQPQGPHVCGEKIQLQKPFIKISIPVQFLTKDPVAAHSYLLKKNCLVVNYPHSCGR